MTAEQKQHLLAFLGYYKGEVDNIWGPLSERATKDFQQAYGLYPDGIFGKDTEAEIRRVICEDDTPMEDTTVGGDWWSGIKYWSREEFRCQCGGKYCDGFPAEPNRKLVELADQVREHFGSPGHRTSGLRCVTHNANEGGVSDSRHMSGKALDFWIEGQTAATVLAYVQTLPGVRYAYAIDGDCIHMDVD